MATLSLQQFSQQARKLVIDMVHEARASHVGGALSVIDILACLYHGGILNVSSAAPDEPDRDRLIFSKGHCTAALYAVLALEGFFPKNLLKNYGKDDSPLLCHTSHHVPGVEFSTGSLGHGLPFGTGCALAAKRQSKDWNVYVVLSDGELNEGSNWEAILSAAHLKLDNLTVIVDCNGSQGMGATKEILNLEPLTKKTDAFGWDTVEIDGHDHDALMNALTPSSNPYMKPRCIIANTTKGKGVSFMQGKLEWHYRSPEEDEYKKAIKQLFS